MIVRRVSLSAHVVIGIMVLWSPGASPGALADAQASGPAVAPVASAEAPGRMTVPKGFAVTLFAAEPDVVQPIAFTIDPRGRLWVIENYSYPIWLGGPRGKDRILIFEDADGDGRFDRRTVFFDKGTNFTGIELGFGGVWVCASAAGHLGSLKGDPVSDWLYFNMKGIRE